MPLVDAVPVSAAAGTWRVHSSGEAARAHAQMQRLVVATRAVADQLALPPLYRCIAESARRLVDAEHIALGVLSTAGAATQLIQLEAGDSHAMTMAADFDELAGLSGLAARLTAGVVARFTSAELELALPGAWGDGLLAVPIHYRSEVLAVLLLRDIVAGCAWAADEDALLSLAATAGIAIENARLYEESRRRQEWGREASEISNLILAAPGQSEARDLITGAVRRLVDADLAVWWRPTALDPDVVEVVAAIGPGSEEISRRTYPLATFRLTSTNALRGTLGTVGPERGSPVAEVLRHGGVEALLLLPVDGDGDSGVRGWLMCGRRRDNQSFSDLDLDIAATFLAQMGVAMDLARTRTIMERMHILEDRERIARDLHDHVIQSLFATGLKVRTAGGLPTGAARQIRLDEAVAEIDDSIRQLRALIFQLTVAAPAAPDSFTESMVRVVDALTLGLGFRPHLSLEGPLDTVISPLLTTEIIAVLREAGTNVGRHAQSSRVAITMVTDTRTFSLGVTDDGVGIGAALRRSGLNNLRLRAEILGGTLGLEEPPGGGTAVRWSIPLAT